MQRLHDQCVVMLSQDSFYRGLTPEECKNVKGKQVQDRQAQLQVAIMHYGNLMALIVCSLQL